MSDHADLIDTLVARHRALGAGYVGRLIVIAAAVGAAVIVLLVARLGFRSDLSQAMADMIFWTKIVYGGGLAMIALAAVAILARPDGKPPAWMKLAAIPVVVLMILAGIESYNADPVGLRELWLGKTALVCPALILMLSLPCTAALMLAVRQCAPTQLRATGATVGLASGGIATALYALHCPESSFGFVLMWYSLGILLAVAVGCLAGPRLLRWS